MAARNHQIKCLRTEVAKFRWGLTLHRSTEHGPAYGRLVRSLRNVRCASGIAFYLHRRQREAQIQEQFSSPPINCLEDGEEHLDNEKHRLRALLLIQAPVRASCLLFKLRVLTQAWWKGCVVRGFEAAHRV